MVINRLYLTTEDVSRAIIEAGMELRPEDQSSLKLGAIADSLGELMRDRVRAETKKFLRDLTDKI